MFPCEYCEIFKSNIFIEHLRWLSLNLIMVIMINHDLKQLRQERECIQEASLVLSNISKGVTASITKFVILKFLNFFAHVETG